MIAFLLLSLSTVCLSLSLIVGRPRSKKRPTGEREEDKRRNQSCPHCLSISRLFLYYMRLMVDRQGQSKLKNPPHALTFPPLTAACGLSLHWPAVKERTRRPAYEETERNRAACVCVFFCLPPDVFFDLSAGERRQEERHVTPAQER